MLNGTVFSFLKSLIQQDVNIACFSAKGLAFRRALPWLARSALIASIIRKHTCSLRHRDYIFDDVMTCDQTLHAGQNLWQLAAASAFFTL